jgi:MerR HTH family regulatory protein
MRILPEADHFLTGDVARALHVTEEGVRHLVRDEQLPCRRTPKGYRLFEAAAVEALAQKRTRARLRGVKVLRPKKFGVRGEPRQLSLFGLRRVK